MHRKGAEWSMIITALLTLIIVFVAFPAVSGPIKKVVSGTLGVNAGSDEARQVQEQEFQQSITDAYQYCGIGQTKAYCKCPLPIPAGEKVYLRGLSDGRTAVSPFTTSSVNPKIQNDGQIDPTEKAVLQNPSGELPIGPLCLHVGDWISGANTRSVLSIPPDAGIPAAESPNRFEQFGIILSKTNAGVAWTANVKQLEGWFSYGYQEWNAEPAVFWRKEDNTRCIWLPWVESKLVGANTLRNPVPDCDAVSIDLSAAKEQFDAVAKAISDCQKNSATVLTECGHVILDLPEGLRLGLTQELGGWMLALRYTIGDT